MSEIPKTVLVDMDGVLADFDGRVIELLRQDYPEVPIPDSRTNFYIADDFATEHQAAVAEIQSREGFFAGMQPLPFVFNGLQRIINYGYEPRICTANLTANATCSAEKLEWLERHFGRRFGTLALDAIIDKDKHLHDGVALIDDKPDIPHATTAPWTHVSFAQPYNIRTSAPLRLNGWMDHGMPRLLKIARDNYRAQLAAA